MFPKGVVVVEEGFKETFEVVEVEVGVVGKRCG